MGQPAQPRMTVYRPAPGDPVVIGFVITDMVSQPLKVIDHLQGKPRIIRMQEANFPRPHKIEKFRREAMHRHHHRNGTRCLHAVEDTGKRLMIRFIKLTDAPRLVFIANIDVTGNGLALARGGSVNRHAGLRRLPHTMVEYRNDMISNDKDAFFWAKLLADGLQEALEDPAARTYYEGLQLPYDPEKERTYFADLVERAKKGEP